jgi:hypothetical protein
MENGALVVGPDALTANFKLNQPGTADGRGQGRAMAHLADSSASCRRALGLMLFVQMVGNAGTDLGEGANFRVARLSTAMRSRFLAACDTLTCVGAGSFQRRSGGRRRGKVDTPNLLRLSIGFWMLSCCCSTSCFAADGFISRELRIEGRIQSITLGDFNGDSRSDLAVRTLDAVMVVLNAGGGDFSPPIRTALRYGFALAGVTDYGVGRAEIAADFNCDGKLDLAIRDRSEILIGVGDGTFLPPQAIGGEFASFYGLTADGDFNGDQKPDLVFFVRGSVAILLGNGDGTFQSGSMAEFGSDGQILVADFNRDGRSDLAYLRYHYATENWDPNCCDVRIFLGQGDGAFLDTDPISGVVAGGMLSADFNGDGIPDIGTVNAVLLGNGDGAFQSNPRIRLGSPFEEELKIFYATPSDPGAAADLDGDTHIDLVGFDSNNTEGRSTGFYRGNGDGTLTPAFAVHLWEKVDRRVGGIADLDGDNRPDVVTAVYCPLSQPQGDHRALSQFCPDRSNNITVFLNRIEVASR